MSVFNIPSRLYNPGATTLGPVNKPANASLMSVQVAAPTDWQTGTAGRSVDLAIQNSLDGGASWNNVAESSLVTPNMGHNGAFPTLLEVDVSDLPAGVPYRAIVTFSDAMTVGWTITLQ